MKNIVLIGLMGSGKTTVGKLIAEKLKFNFIDTDELIEKQENKKISDIFAENGEEYFRKVEQDIVKTIAGQENQVISTGGGIVKNIQNIQNLKENGVLFYLSASSSVLYERLKSEKANRPLLKTENLLETISNLLNEREEKYKMADFIINTEDKSPKDISEEIIALIGVKK